MNTISRAPLLEVAGLSVSAQRPDGPAGLLHDISFRLNSGEVLGVVGETGAGKSVLARSIIGLLPRGLAISGGAISFGGVSLGQLPERDYRRLRGGQISLIGTNAKALLDPVATVGVQVARVIGAHVGHARRQAWDEAVGLLRSVGIAAPEQRARAYPHELSGGMAQRVVIAMALAGRPKLILADDATLGLDATVQVQVLDLLTESCRARGCAILLITHDIGIVARYCQQVAVMRSGRLIELGHSTRFLDKPVEPYSAKLLAAARARPVRREALHVTAGATPLLQVEGLRKLFPATGARDEVRAIDGVDFSIDRGQTLALVGESGSGKTTAGQCLLHLVPATGGRIVFDGTDITRLPAARFLPYRRRMQMVFQEPFFALNPRWRVQDLVSEPFSLLPPMTGQERARRVARLLEAVQIPLSLARAYPHELTAGEQKRIGIARALATDPEFIVFDEPTTALDVTVRAFIIDLIRDLQTRLGLSALFITHDLNSVRSLAHRVAVMNRGVIVESGDTETIFSAPREDYTRTLLAAELPTHIAEPVGADA